MAGDRAAIYHRDTRKAVTLNPVGTILWQALAYPQTHASLVSLLSQQFADVPAETLSADVTKFLEQMLSHQLVVTA